MHKLKIKYMTKSNKLAMLLMAFAITAMPLIFTSCSSGDDSDEENIDSSNQDKTEIHHNVSIENQLKNSSWKQYKRISGGRTLTNIERALSFTSTPIEYGNYGTCYRLKSGNKYSGIWYVLEDGSLWINSYKSDYDAKEKGENASGYGVGKLQMLKNTTNELIYCMKLSSEDNYYYYTSINTGGDSDSGNGSSSYEKPDIAFDDFTAYQTKLKVVYKIYNKDKANVTSAKVYYGTSSNPTKSVSATVAGVLITANISGLNKGTTYYVKCVATGKGGTTTTETTKVITNY